MILSAFQYEKSLFCCRDNILFAQVEHNGGSSFLLLQPFRQPPSLPSFLISILFFQVSLHPLLLTFSPWLEVLLFLFLPFDLFLLPRFSWKEMQKRMKGGIKSFIRGRKEKLSFLKYSERFFKLDIRVRVLNQLNSK